MDLRATVQCRPFRGEIPYVIAVGDARRTSHDQGPMQVRRVSATPNGGVVFNIENMSDLVISVQAPIVVEKV